MESVTNNVDEPLNVLEIEDVFTSDVHEVENTNYFGFGSRLEENYKNV